MEERFALYYPYIHFCNPQWLKSALLTFGQMRRMVPREFELHDESFVRELRSHPGRLGLPLITEEPLEEQCVLEAHQRLRDRLDADADAATRFSRETMLRMGLDEYEIFPAKISNPLIDFLNIHGIAWPTQSAHPQMSGAPIGLHPRLGEAIMSVTAIAIARHKGLSIVTPDTRIHHALITHNEDAVFEALSRPDLIPQPIKIDTDEFLQAILIHTFDLTTLSAQDLSSLSAEFDGLRGLRLAIESEISTIPPIADQAERRRRATAAAVRIKEKWSSSKKNAVWEGIKTVADVSTLDLPATVSSLIAGGVATYASVPLGIGLAVAFVPYAGIRAWKGFKEATNSPYRYLTLVSERAKMSAVAANVHSDQ